MKEIVGRSVLILGYGREGQSVYRFLSRHRPGLKIGIADREKLKPVAGVKLHTGADYLAALSGYDTVVRSPGISPFLPELGDYQKSGGHLTSATNIFFSECPGMVVGITGTKGKSTTASLIAHILKTTETYRGSPFARSVKVQTASSPSRPGAKAVTELENARRAVSFPDVRLVGNIGRPVLDYLPGATKETIFVVELSSHQLTDIRYSPQMAVILPIVPEHLDYYPDIGTYAAAKGQIVKFQTKDDAVVFNPDHELARVQAAQSQGQKLTYSLTPKSNCVTFVASGVIKVKAGRAKESVMPVAEIPLLGNLENVLAAITIASFLGVPMIRVAQAIRQFKPLPHRLELVGQVGGISFYNDSLATIPEATIHALKALGSDVETLIAGGYDRGLEFTKLGEYLSRSSVKTLILFPPTGEKIWQALGKAKIHPYFVQTMEEAVRLAFQHTPAGKICLLSPASASFGTFRDYADRGEQFKAWIKALGTSLDK